MLLLHLSDIHAGKRLHAYDLTEDLRHVLRQAVRTARERGADAVLVSGDLYDSARPSPSAVETVDEFLTALGEAQIPCVVIPGNHDAPERVAYGSALLGRQGLHLLGAYDGQVRPVTLEDEHGPLRLWPLPFVRPADVQAALGTERLTHTQALQAVVDRLELDPRERNVALAHQFVTAGGQEPERQDSELAVGGLDNVDAAVFEPFDYVALGHLHGAQQVGRPEVRYCGTPLAFSAGEAGRPKTMTLVSVGQKDEPVGIEQVPFEPLHAVRRIRGPLEALVSPDVVGSAPADDYVYAVLTDEEPVLDAGPRLRDAYARLLGFERSGSQASKPAASVAVHVPDVGETDGLFEEFFLLQTGRALSPEQRQLVVDLLQEGGDVL